MKKYYSQLSVLGILTILLAGCGSSFQPSSGPTISQIKQSKVVSSNNLLIIDVNSGTIKQTQNAALGQRFSDYFHGKVDIHNTILPGDIVDITIWETAPALLFGSIGENSTLNSSKEVKLSEQMVDPNGRITIPFVGDINVLGKTPKQVQNNIITALSRKANNPSVIVRIIKNNSSSVTIIGEVNNNLQMPLTSKGERVLDAIAIAGGVKHPSNRISVQLSRGEISAKMTLEDIINNHSQNVILKPGDVISVNYRSNSFTVLGAAAKNDEIDFESKGISLVQALARSGGLDDNKADARGVFIFRYETPNALVDEQIKNLPEIFIQTERVPVIYRLDLSDPMNYLLAQQFMVKDKDVLYVSNAPAVEFNKFLGMISQTVYSINGITGLIQ